jgi:hypothetical protein
VPVKDQSGNINVAVRNDLLQAVSQLFAWQFGGTILDPKYAVQMCNKDLSSLKDGLDLVDMLVDPFVGVFCEQFQTDLPPAGYVQKMSQDLLTKMYATALFGLSHNAKYLCTPCNDVAFDENRFPQVGLNVSDWQRLRSHACGPNGYSDTRDLAC